MLQMYPRWKYSDSAPDGRLVASVEEEAALGEGWRDNPDPNYVKPAPLGPTDGLPADAIARGFVIQPYPAWRYGRDGSEILVKDAEEDAALPAGEYSNKADFAGAPPAPSPSPSASPASEAPIGDADEQAEAKRKAAEELNAKARELHATSVQHITDALEGCTDRDVLRQVQTLEALNPEPRVTLMKFVAKALQALDAPPATS